MEVTHEFEYAGQKILYRSGLVRDAVNRRVMCRKLLASLGGGAISETDNEAAYDFADFLTHTSPFKADWRREPGDTSESLLTGYQAFVAAGEDVYTAFNAARTAIQELKAKG